MELKRKTERGILANIARSRSDSLLYRPDWDYMLASDQIARDATVLRVYLYLRHKWQRSKT